MEMNLLSLVRYGNTLNQLPFVHVITRYYEKVGLYHL